MRRYDEEVKTVSVWVMRTRTGGECFDATAAAAAAAGGRRSSGETSEARFAIALRA